MDVPVTGLDTLPQRPGALLVSTRDSRVRLYQGTSPQVKYKGHRAKTTSMIRATFSQDGMYVISGSDDGCAPAAPSRARFSRQCTHSATERRIMSGAALHASICGTLDTARTTHA